MGCPLLRRQPHPLLAAACAALRDAPSDTAAHDALLATLPNYAELQRRLNRALQGDLPYALRRRRQPLTIDLALIPYHGKPLHSPDEIFRSQTKNGTSHFHAYATAYVIRKGRRFTVALTPVGRHDTLADALRRLLREAARAGVRPRYLLLDHGFCSVDVNRYLQNARYAWLMPLVLRGRKADHPKGALGSRVFASRKRRGWAEYTMTNAAKHTVRFRVCIKCRNRRGERGRQGREALVYAFGGPLRPTSYTWVKETYRSRFAIETSYRQMHQVRIRTCTRDPPLRLLYVGIALRLNWAQLVADFDAAAAAVVCRDSVAAAERVGLVAQAGVGTSADRPGAVELSQDAGVVATLGRSAFGDSGLSQDPGGWADNSALGG